MQVRMLRHRKKRPARTTRTSRPPIRSESVTLSSDCSTKVADRKTFGNVVLTVG